MTLSDPTHRLLGEALAWPLVDRVAFDQGMVALTEDAINALLPGYRTRAHALAHHPAPDHDARHVWQQGSDYPGQLRERSQAPHSRNADSPRTIPDLLQETARRLIRRDGDINRLRDDPEAPGQDLLRWRELSLSLPPGLLLAAATPAGTRPSLRLQLLTRDLRPDTPIALLHLHLGASYPLEVLWSGLAKRLDEVKAPKREEEPRDWPDLQRWLVRAMVARRCLAARWQGSWLPDLEHPLPRQWVHRALRELRLGRLEDTGATDMEAVLAGWAVLQRSGKPGKAETLAELWRTDPIADGDDWPEGRFLQRGLRAQEGELRLFLQYLRVKVALFRHLLHDRAQPGLDTFVRTYARIGTYASLLDETAIGLDLACTEPDLDLRSVEVRKGPPKTEGDLVRLVTRSSPTLARHWWRPPRPLSWGWSIHFIRAKGKVTDDPTGTLQERFAEFRSQAGTLERVLRYSPQLLTVIRSLDLAGEEQEGPLWLALPWLRRLLALSQELVHRSPHLSLHPLQMSLHLGEDYVSPLTGLRAVGEALDWRLLHARDRMGHALALAEDTKAWYKTHRTYRQPAWRRLQDVLWALDAVRCPAPYAREVALGGELRAQLEREVLALAEEIWGVPVSIRCLRELRATLGHPSTLPDLALRDYEPTASAPLPVRLIAALFSREETGRQACRVVEIVPRAEGELVAQLQLGLRRHLARMRVAVELNPSSNAVIGGYSGILDQGPFSLRSYTEDRDDLLPITLNTDDPTPFVTDLSHELAYTWAGLVVQQGHPARDVEAWLRERARDSMRFRFTDARTADGMRGVPVPGV
ncbi:MAG: hypothetical protein JXX28_15335 [Deltaproteobacteria bacterium]|nr:hypothetical protein [Deltaproteobacteria bacterium]